MPRPTSRQNTNTRAAIRASMDEMLQLIGMIEERMEKGTALGYLPKKLQTHAEATSLLCSAL